MWIHSELSMARAFSRGYVIRIGKQVRDALHRDLSLGFARSARGSEEAGACQHKCPMCITGCILDDGSDICPLGADGVGTTAIVPGI